jgi:hypothetical protein
MINDDECGAVNGMRIWELAGEVEVLGENLPQSHFVHHTWSDLGSNQGRHDGKSATNRLSYDTAMDVVKTGKSN